MKSLLLKYLHLKLHKFCGCFYPMMTRARVETCCNQISNKVVCDRYYQLFINYNNTTMFKIKQRMLTAFWFARNPTEALRKEHNVCTVNGGAIWNKQAVYTTGVTLSTVSTNTDNWGSERVVCSQLGRGCTHIQQYFILYFHASMCIHGLMLEAQRKFTFQSS